MTARRDPTQPTRRRLGRILLDEGAISEDQLRIGLREQQTTKRPLGAILIDLGFVTDSIVRDALSANTGQRSVDLTQTYQKVAGAVQAGAVKSSLDIPVLVGDSLKFEARLPSASGTQPLAFEGKVNGDSIEATVVLAGRTSKVVAKRTAQ